MDETVRQLERRWLETGDETDRFRWLCRKHSLGVDPALEQTAQAVMDEAHAVFGDERDVSVICRVGFETSDPHPLRRLAHFSNHGAWFPAQLRPSLTAVLDVQGMVSLYPHDDYETETLSRLFLQLFEDGVAFCNYTDGGGRGTEWWRSVRALEGCREDWEFNQNLAVGATLGPLVGFLSVNARESL